MNLFEKIVELKKQTEGFYKDTKSYGYNYVSGSQILDKITPLMNELGLLFLPKSATHRGWQERNYVNQKGQEKTDFIVDGDLVYCWVNANEPKEVWEIPFQYYGAQDDISKAFGSALTYSERYLLLKSLGLPTDEDDPDSKDTRDKTYKKAETRRPFKKQEETVQEETQSPEEAVTEHNKKRYQAIVRAVAGGILDSGLEPEAKVTMAKRILNNYIIQDLKLDFKKIEFVNKTGEKLVNTNIEVLVGETIDKCVAKANQEIAMFNSQEEEI